MAPWATAPCANAPLAIPSPARASLAPHRQPLQHQRRGRAASFTLIELVVVLAIAGMMMGLFAIMPQAAHREATVEAAAQELAGTLRQARALAIRSRAVHAVVFNIRNTVGSSGLVLRNGDGGHWYRILGPWPRNGDDTMPPWTQLFRDGYLLMQDFLNAMNLCWIGEAHVLKAHEVRFIALSDQDNGGFVEPSITWTGDGRQFYQPTYPRPWFGDYDPSSGRLHAWGGYDHSLVNPRRGHSTTGFWYEGGEGAITGSCNPSNRSAGSYQLYQQGEGRALVDARFEDYWILFYPDGSVAEGPIMNAREQSYCRGFQAGPGGQALADRYEDIGNEWDVGSPMTSYQSYTGYWMITLGPDSRSDSDHFANAKSALESLMPAYRVGVSALGEVTVFKVKRELPPGAQLDTVMNNWQNQTLVQSDYLWNTRTSGSVRSGMPVMDALTPDMLNRHQWWLTP
jgi:hypothetical protein